MITKTVWTNLQGIMLSQISQSLDNHSNDSNLYNILEMTMLQEIGNRLAVARG